MEAASSAWTRKGSCICFNRRFYPLLMGLPFELREHIYYYIFLEDFLEPTPIRASTRQLYNRSWIVADNYLSTLAEAEPLNILPDLCCVNRTLLHESFPVFLRSRKVMLIGRGTTHAFCKLLHLVPANTAYLSVRLLHVAVFPMDNVDVQIMKNNGTPTHTFHLIKLCAPSLRHLAIEINAACLTKKSRHGWAFVDKNAILRMFDFIPV